MLNEQVISKSRLEFGSVLDANPKCRPTSHVGRTKGTPAERADY